MLAIKNDDFIEQPPIVMSKWIAKTVQQHREQLPFASYFNPNAVLVPVPKSTLMQPGSLWVPHRLSMALVERNLGREVFPCLARVTPVRKAAWSDPSERPSPTEQYATIGVQGQISEPPPNNFVLVDDIVTRGATLLGAANRLAEAFPNAQIHAFAAMRTISVPSEFAVMYEPVSGTIEYREWADDTLRRP
jgi:predicted amidophosphoribosyltransferase